ncbi:MAG: CheR family methyltransferase [Rubrivivax sp.]
MTGRTSRPRRRAPGTPAGSSGTPPCAVVALGASAGGLQALEQFFGGVPAHSGLAFVVLQHRDSRHPGLLAEILQRATTLPVVQAEAGTVLLPDRVHVLPPHRALVLQHGTLQAGPAEVPGAQPIDDFFESLAQDLGARATAIVLSGQGRDGSQGLRAVAAAGGRCLVQEPSTARAASMPRSALQAVPQARALAAPDMGAVLAQPLPPAGGGAAAPAGEAGEADDADEANEAEKGVGTAGPEAELLQDPQQLQRVLLQLRAATGHDFCGYKRNTMARRVARRMAQLGLADVQAYVTHLKEQPAEAQALFRELLINVTQFFRDPEAFAALRTEVLPGLLAGLDPLRPLRVWVAGCATGEEAYSIAILLREALDGAHAPLRTQIYATDLDEEAIAVARAGRYPASIAQDVGPERLARFFTEDDKGYRLRKEIREMVVFAVQSVVRDPPFSRLHLLSCRNVMIYLEPALQERLVRTFHHALEPGGALMLSPSESVGEHAELFEPVSRKWKLYRARPALPETARAALTAGVSWMPERGGPLPPAAGPRARESQLSELARHALLSAFAPAAVVVDRQGGVLYVHGETGPFLRPAPGLPSLNVVEMAVQGLQAPLREALDEAVQGGRPTLARVVTLPAGDAPAMTVSLGVRPLPAQDESPGLLLVSFQPAGPAGAAPARRRRSGRLAEDGRVQELEREIAYVKESMSAVLEEHQAANEELKSANEELQSTNEELQSTNEELETSKEELQSLNEELVTVNAELENKIEQMAVMQDDMKNLLDSMRLGIVFLDTRLCIRRFSRDAAQIFRLQAGDIGRALADIRSEVPGEDLLADAQQVLDTLVPVEREVLTQGQRRYTARIQPYRTVDNVIDGVVLTFAEVPSPEAGAAGPRS